MTGRDQLTRERQRLSLAMLAGVGLMAAGLAASQVFGLKPLGAAAGVGIAVLFAAGLGAQVIGFRCPWCRGKLGSVLSHSGWWRMDPKVRFCPYCGAAFDDELDAPPGGTTRWGDRLTNAASGPKWTRRARPRRPHDSRLRDLAVISGVA